MIEAALSMFEMDVLFKIVTKTTTDTFYGKTESEYVDVTAKAVITPHSYTLQETDTNIGIDSYGKIDVYIRNMTLKRDDLVQYMDKMYTVIDTTQWNTTMGVYNCYVCQI